MKSKLLVFSSLVLAVILVSSCDMFRRLAGRPTSDDIDRMRLEILDEENAARMRAEEEARLENARILAEKAKADSIAYTDSLGGYLRDRTRMGVPQSVVLPGQYYVIIGAFKEIANAERLVSRVSAAGYEATVITFRNGNNAVGICRSDDPKSAFEALCRLKKEDFCPKEAWVLVNRY